MIIKNVENNRRFIGIFGLETQGVDLPSLLNSVNELSKESRVVIQLFDSSLIATWEHLFFGALNAIKAFRYGKNISNNLSVECLLYVSGQRQISVAVENFGVKQSTRSMGIILIGDTQDLLTEARRKILQITKGTENDAVLSINEDKFRKIRSFFQITEIELDTIRRSDDWNSYIDALTRYCIERSSLLTLQR
ncbi:MAG: KEOPS complex subunit Cgi121 [Candidatus Freyarchaeota archaeon]